MTIWFDARHHLPETDGKNDHGNSVLVYVPERKGCRQHGLYIGKLLEVKPDPEGKNFWGVPRPGSAWTLWGWSYFEEPVVTHWTPLPKPPVDSKGEAKTSADTGGEGELSKTLKPCPFCGGEAVIQRDSLRNYYVCCKATNECAVTVRTDRVPTPEEAIEIWNRRAVRTCRNIAPARGGLFDGGDTVLMHFRCSECEADHYCHHDMMPEYCPHCGAKVVDK